MIRVYKRRWYGLLVCVAEFSRNHEIVVSTDGVLTIREPGCRDAVMALQKCEWNVAKRCDI